MKINYKEKSTVEIINFYNSKNISVNNIDKIYVGFKVFLFLKMYYLKIKTKDYKNKYKLLMNKSNKFPN